MRVLLIYPVFPPSFWSFEKTLELFDQKAMLPPLGLVTVAALLPQEWEFKLVDRNVRDITEEEWHWADMVMLSGMIVQKADMHAQIAEAKRRGKSVAVGGPYATSLPDHFINADYRVLDEGEITIPMFLAALARGDKTGVFRADGEKPDVTSTPVPKFELLEFDAYWQMPVQFSRGCPFLCEFCDIIVLYGRKPRTKTSQQMLAELDRLHELGWRRSIFVVDDNFIGNRKNVKNFLHDLKPWLESNGYPFSFATEASVDLAQDQELMDSMVTCNFNAVFLGVETPDPDSLVLTKKTQNNRDPLEESVTKIARSGLRVMAGFIIGFDNEKSGAGQRIVDFVERTSIPTATFSMLQALPDTGLWKRLAASGRLIGENIGDINQTTLLNFVPTRPVEEIAKEYVDGFWELYDPIKYLDRTYRHFLLLKHGKFPDKPESAKKKFRGKHIYGLLKILWRQGVVRKTRWRFWRNLRNLRRENPGGVTSYLSTCAHMEHYLHYRQLVRSQIQEQLRNHITNPPKPRIPQAIEACHTHAAHVPVTISAEGKSKPFITSAGS